MQRLLVFALMFSVQIWGNDAVTPCGEYGDVRSRIIQCGIIVSSKKKDPAFSLVMVDHTGRKWWRDNKSKLVWATPLQDLQTPQQAHRSCGAPFSLPTKVQIKQAEKRGLFNHYSGEKQNFWVKDTSLLGSHPVRYFNLSKKRSFSNSNTATALGFQDIIKKAGVICTADLEGDPAYSLLDDPSVFAAAPSSNDTTKKLPFENLDSDQIRVAEFVVNPKDPKTRLVLIGLDRSSDPNWQSADMTTMGFKVPEAIKEKMDPSYLRRMEPLFLISLNRAGVEKVYTFDSDNYASRKFIETFDGKLPGGPKRYYVEILPEDNTSGMPKLLLDVAQWKWDYYKDLGQNIFIKALSYVTFLAPVSAVAKWLRMALNEQDIYQAHGLRHIIEEQLDHKKYPHLTAAFSREELDELGSALMVTRKANGSLLQGLFVSEENMSQVYELHRAIRKQNSRSNMAKLIQAAATQGIYVIPFSENFAFSFYTKHSLNQKNYWNDFLIDSDNPQDLPLEKNRKLAQLRSQNPEHQLIPLGVFALNESSTPIQLSDYHYPDKHIKRENFIKILRLAKDTSFSFFTMGTIGLAINVADDLVIPMIKFIVKKSGKSGSTIFEQRVGSDAELATLLLAGGESLEWEDVLTESLLEQFKELNPSTEEMNRYQNMLKSGDRAQTEQVAREILWKFSIHQSEGRLFSGISLGETLSSKMAEISRLRNLLQQNHDPNALYFLKQELEEDLAEKLMLKKERRIAYKKFQKDMQLQLETSSQKKSAPTSALVFMIDGLSPKRLKAAAKLGWVPTLKQLFLDNGVEFESYASRSLTLPSWSTLFTGVEPDRHGIRSNTPSSRVLGESSENLQDFRPDLLYVLENNPSAGRANQRLKAAEVLRIEDYFPEGEVLMSFNPLFNMRKLPLPDFILELPNELAYLFNQAWDPKLSFDYAIAEDTIEALMDNPGKYRLIGTWFAGIDHCHHFSNQALEFSFRRIDFAINKIVKQAQKDPILKDAKLVLVSDHGMMGGATLAGEKHDEFINNTGFNLIKFFAGDYGVKGHPDFERYLDYQFVVGAAESPDPDHDLFFLSEFFIHPFNYNNYRGLQDNDGPQSLLVDYSGDNVAQVFLRQQFHSWGADLAPMSYHELSNYQFEPTKNSPTLDIISDLLTFEHSFGTESADPKIREQIKHTYQNRPVGLFAMALRDEHISVAITKYLGIKSQLSRPPVLIQSFDAKKNQMLSGLILARGQGVEQEQFLYYPVVDFNQDQNGNYFFRGTTEPHWDPIRLGKKYGSWGTDRTWLSEFKDHQYPTIVFGLVRLLTLSPQVDNTKLKGESPDFVLMANPGFNFNGSAATEGDHGGFHFEEVRHSLFLSGIGESHLKKSSPFKSGPWLSRDFLPGLLHLLDRPKPSSKDYHSHWRSWSQGL